MITVSVAINGTVIYARSAVNISDEGRDKERKHNYHVDIGKVVQHVPDEGVVVLAKKLLDTIKE